MESSTDSNSFEQKWHARWPEWSVAMGFVAAPQRPRVSAWFALLQEFGDAAFAGDDPTPGLAKLAWWQEELLGWSKGARRHPLGAVLQAVPAPWAMLARALPDLQAQRQRPGEPASPSLEPGAFAEAVSRCAAALFDVEPADAAAVAAMQDALARERLLLYPQSAAAAPASGNPGTGLLPRPHAIHAALVVARVGQRSAPLPPLRALVAAWTGARRGARRR